MVNVNMTDEQKKFIEECENEFKDRYTEKDSAFMKIKEAGSRKPPIFDPWYRKPRRYNDWGNRNQERGRRNHDWSRRNNDRDQPPQRHAGKHHMHYRNRYY